MGSFSYEESLERSYRANWRIEEVLGVMNFDLRRPWLPSALSGGDVIFCLNREERRLLTHVEMGSYAHLFGYVEAFIAPQMVDLALDSEVVNRPAFEALTNFASEEVKHMYLFRRVRAKVDEQLGFSLMLVDHEGEFASSVLARNRGAVLLLTTAIEWLTQHHFQSAMKNTDELDPAAKELFRFHWMEEAQHTRLDYLETMRVFKEMPEADRTMAIEDLIWLLAALDGILVQQSQYDLANYGHYIGYAFPEVEQKEVFLGLLQAKRRCFIQDGIAHPQFVELLQNVTTPAQRIKIQLALSLLLKAGATP